jgi:hypothetical protein
VNDDEIRNHFLHLEQLLQDPEVRKDRKQLGELLAPDFIEYGSSGRVYNRQQVIEALALEEPMPLLTIGLKVKLLGEGFAFVTYESARLSVVGRTAHASLRSSLWRFDNDRWQMVFHQGTLKA